MYRNPFPLCKCGIKCCGCCHMHSFEPHYRRLLQVCRPKDVFEWGPGLSTHIALEHAADVFTIESSIEFAAALPQDQHLAVLITPVEASAYLELHGKYHSDLFFVDGRRRVECLELVRKQAKPAAVVCLHDAQRARYNEALRRFKHVDYLERGFAVASMDELPRGLG